MTDGGAYFSLRVATGNANWGASEDVALKALTQQRTAINYQVILTNDTAIFYDMNPIENSTEGAFQCKGQSLFHNQVCISGRSTKPDSGTYRAFGLGGNAVYTSSSNYSLIIGGQSRILCAAGSELNTHSDIREKNVWKHMMG